jgi:hypothetical protein
MFACVTCVLPFIRCKLVHSVAWLCIISVLVTWHKADMERDKRGHCATQ